jgi:hypothetical protein
VKLEGNVLTPDVSAGVNRPKWLFPASASGALAINVTDKGAKNSWFETKLEAAGVKLDRPYTKTPFTALAFIYDPWGTYIELNERPNPVYIDRP